MSYPPFLSVGQNSSKRGALYEGDPFDLKRRSEI
jgi:hypothetical protein